MYGGSVRHLESWRGKAIARYFLPEYIRNEHQVSFKKKLRNKT